MTLAKQIAYWRGCAERAPLDGAAFIAMGVMLGIRMAQHDLTNLVTEAAEHVRHAPDCRAGSDDQCTCGAVDFLDRLSAALSEKGE